MRILFCFFVSFVAGLNKGYIPDGLSEKKWNEIKELENKPKDYGKTGISAGFRSRSMSEFLKLKEKGLIDYNMPVFNAQEKLKSGKIKKSDVPYMQRKGGKPDDSDLTFFDRIYPFFEKFLRR